MTRIMLALLLLIPLNGICDENRLNQVLSHFSQDQHGVFDYQETRELELTTTPWQGQGLMLTDNDGTLVKLQLQPERIIMAIRRDTLYYWDPGKNQRHSMPISFGEDVTQQILIFRQILQGQISELQQHYQLTADITDKDQWSLQLRPKQPEQHTIATISISGQQNKRQILIRQTDGESTEYRIEKAPRPIAEHYSIVKLLQEASGE